MKHKYNWVGLRIAAALIGWSFLLTGALAQTPVRLTGIGSSGSDPKEFATYNGRLYFSAKTSTDGQEVYSTNATTVGTSLLKNINTDAGQGADPRDFTEYNGKLYFSATAGSSGRELWVTDGSASGTVLVKDIFPGGGSGDPKELTSCNGRLYFVAQSGPQRELWVTDGTAGGTQRLSDALGVPTGGFNPTNLTCSGDKLFYSVFRDLWFTNGTAANTKFVKGGPLSPLNPDGPLLFISLSQFTALDGKIVFRGNSPGTEDEPWVSDGTPDGTFTLDATPGGLGSFPTDFYAYNGRVYFYAAILNSFWSTDGTIAGTQQIKKSFKAEEMTGFNGKVYFFFGSRLWVTDGTEAGTLSVKDLGGQPSELTVVGNQLHLVVRSGSSSATGGQIWTSDGTEAGTVPLYTINHPSGFVSQSVRELVNYNGQLLFTAATQFQQNTPPTPELWALNYNNLPPVAPAAGIADYSGTVGVSIHQVIPSFSDPEGFPMSYTLTGLPAGLSFSGGAGGIVVGTPAVAGVFPITVTARDQGGLTTSVTYTLTINPAGGAPTPGGSFQLLAPTYNCSTGAIALNTSGGDGSPIVFSAPGIQRASVTSPTGTVENGLRGDPKPILLQATQGGTTVSFTFDLAAACGGSPSPGGTFQLLAPTYNCSTGAITLNTSGGDGSPIVFSAPGVQRNSPDAVNGTVEDGLRNDPKPILLQATQGGTTVSYSFNLPAACGSARRGAGEPVAELTVRVLANPSVSGTAEVEISGAGGLPLDLRVSDTRGRSIRDERIEQAAPLEKRTVRLNSEPGLYFLRVSTPTQVKTVKILRQ